MRRARPLGPTAPTDARSGWRSKKLEAQDVEGRRAPRAYEPARVLWAFRRDFALCLLARMGFSHGLLMDVFLLPCSTVSLTMRGGFARRLANPIGAEELLDRVILAAAA